MKKTYSIICLLVLAAISSNSLKAQTTVFSDNFDRATFTTATSYGTPATLYKFTLGTGATITTTLVSGSNYRANINSGTGAAAQTKGLFYAPMAPYSSPFSRILSANVGLITWTFNMRTNTAVTSNAPTTTVMAGGIDLCGNAAGNILNGSPKGYGVVFNSSATGGVSLVRFSAGMGTNVALITQTTTIPKTDFYSVRVTYNPATNQWSLYVRDDGASAFADPSSGVTLQQGSSVTDNTYTSQVNVNFGALYTWTAGAGKTMSIDNYQVAVTIPACTSPGFPSGLSYTNTATTSTVTFTPPSPAPTGYILVMSSGALSGTPTNGQAITVGTAVGSNGTIVGVGSGSSVTTSTALTANTNYTMTLFPYNNTGCLGGPVFNTGVSSTNITTCPNAPTLTGAGTPTATTIPGVTWSAPAAGGGVCSTYTYLLNVCTDAGMTISAFGYPSTGSIVTSPFNITGLTSGVTYYYTITAVDTVCNSAPSASNNATTSVVPCSGTPTSGNASSTSTMVTGTGAFTLSLIGASGETGITFQWQSSSCNDVWTNISGVTSNYFFATTEAAPKFYRCNVTCNNSGITAPSTSLYVGRINAAYCNPTSASGCTAGDGVNSFTLAGECGTSINDAGPLLCGATNIDHTGNPAVKLFAGNSYAASINSLVDGDDVYVWIDFDNSGTFDASELIFNTSAGDLVGAPYFYSFSIPIPSVATANPGTHRMRIIANNAQAITTGCTALSFGTSVDYNVQILPNVVLTANSPLCLPGTLTLTSNPSLACGAVYTWSGPSPYSNTTINVNSVSPPANAGVYSVSVSVNGVNSCPAPVTTNVTIYTSPAISGVLAMCTTSTPTFTGSPTGGLWLSSNTGVAVIGSSSGSVAGLALGTTIISYAIPSTGCVSTSTLNVTNPPNVYAVTGGGNYCAGGAGVHILLSGSDIGVAYQLLLAGVPIGSQLIGTGTSLDFGLNTAAGNYTVVANPGVSCATNMSGSATVVINPLPNLFTVTGGGSYCPSGTGVAIGLSGSQGGVSYQLYSSGTPVGVAITGTGFPITFPAQPVGYYNVVATNTTTFCPVYMTGTVAVSLRPLPTAYSVTGGGSFCVGGSGVLVGLAGSTASVSYQLYIGGIATGLPITGTGTAISFGLRIVAGIYTIAATDPLTTCSTNMTGSATVVINPAPAVSNVTGGGVYCAGGTGVHIGLNGSVLGTNYFLYNGVSLVGGASGTGAPLDFGLQTGSGVYTVTGTLSSTGCSGNMTGSATITINPLPFLYNVTGGGTYCAGGSGYHVFLSGSVAGTNYQLIKSGLPVGGITTGTGSAIDFGPQTASGTYSVYAVNTSTGCNSNMNGTVNISINPLPTVYAVTGGGSYCSGGSGFHIGLANSDNGINYQLYNGVTTVGATISGTGGILDFGLQTTAGNYTVVATNTVTSCMNTMGGSALINVIASPSAYGVTGGGNYCFGGTGLPISLSNSTTGVNYQLFMGGSPVGGPLAGSTGGTLNFGIQTLTGTYGVIATDATTGCTNTMTGTAIIGISPLPTPFNVAGGGSYCSGGSGAHVNLSNSSIGVNYQLYNGVTIVGAAKPGTGTSLDFGAKTGAGPYTVVATDATSGCTSNMTGSTSITINPLPLPYLISGGGSYCAGGTGADVSLAASSTGVTYQLYNGVSGIGSAMAGTGGVVDFGLQTIAGIYTSVATDLTTGCTNTMSGSAALVVNALPSLYNVSGGGNDCIGGSGVNVGLNSSNAGISYQLYNGGTAVGSPLTGTGSPLAFGLQTVSGTYTVTATNITTGCVMNMPGVATVLITASPSVYSVTGGGNYCPGTAGVPVGLSGSAPGINYQLLYAGSPVGSLVAGTGSPLNFGLQSTAGLYTITAHGSTPTCVATMSGSAVAGISALPTDHMVTGGGNYCPGGTGESIGLDGSETTVTYQLLNGGSITGSPVAGTGSSLDFGVHTAAGTYTVLATATPSGCINPMPGSAVIGINSSPTTYTISGGGGYCSGDPGVDVLLGGSEPGTNYQLYKNSTLFGPSVAGTGIIIDFGLQTIAGIYTVLATNAITGCTSYMTGAVNVSTNPLPGIFNVSGGGNYCAGGVGVPVLLSGSSSGITYQLYNGPAASGTPLTGTGSALNFGLQTVSGLYTVKATNIITGCTRIMSGSASVSASALPVVYAVTGSSPFYCAGGTGVIITIPGSDPGVTYQLYRGGTSVGGALPGSGGPVSFGPQLTAGAYTVVGTNSTTGCVMNMAGSPAVAIASLPDAFTVTGGGGYCSDGAGVHVQLSGSASGIYYQLYRSGIFTGVSDTGTGGILDFGIQTTSGIYSAIAKNLTSGCITNMNAFATVIANPLPTTYTVIGGGVYCAGGAGLHVGLSGSQSGIQYQLMIGGTNTGLPVSGTGFAISFPLQTATGTYTILAANTATGCSNIMTGSTSISTNPLPAAFPVIGGGNYCAGGTGVPIGLGTTTAGISYQLYKDGIITGTAITGAGTAIDFGLHTASGTYTVVATNTTTGCSNNMTGSVPVIINALPAVFAVTGGGNYCAGGTGVPIGLANSVTGVDYSLVSGSVLVTRHGTGAPLDFGLQTVSGSYSVTAANIATTCAANMTGTATVTVNPLVTPAVNMSTPGGDTACAGRLTTFTATPVNGGLSPTYEWTINGISAGMGNTYAYLPVNGDDVGVIMTGNAMCATSLLAVNIRAITVITNELPGVLISSDHGAEVCQGTPVTFTNILSFGGNAPTYKWMKNNSLAGTSASYSFTPLTGDDVYCILESNYHCRLLDSGISNHIHMTVDAPLTPSVTVTATQGGSVAPGTRIVFTATVVNGGSSPSFQWKLNGGDIIGATLPIYASKDLYDQDVVSCHVTTSGPCSGSTASASVTVHVWADGVQQVNLQNMDVQLIPNPNKGNFTLKGSLGPVTDEEVSLEITDMIGQTVFNNKFLAHNGTIDEQVHMQNVANGMYLLNLRTGNDHKVFHFVVEQ